MRWLNYRDAKDIADSFFTGDCLQVGLTSPPKAVTLVPNAIKYLVKFVPYIREAKDFAVLRNTNKQNLIDLIQSLPDTMLIDVSRSVPEPDGVEYLMGYKGIRTSIVSSATNCKMNISIEYMEKLK